MYNLSEYEAKPALASRVDDLERHEEELCEEERWRALHHDDSEDVIREEEEVKRSGAGANQFQFNYEAAESGVVFGPEVPDNLEQETDDSEEYVPHPSLDLPPGVTPPKTVKQFSVIEKTALLIAKQGPQMEILLKTKQSDNPVFDFLSIDHSFNKFYKHLILLVKTKQYRPHQTTPPPPPPPVNNVPQSVSLVPQYSDAAPDIDSSIRQSSSVQYKPSQDCAYSQLINKLQKFAPPPPAPPVTQDHGSSQSSKESSPAPQVTMPDGPIIIPPPDLQTIVDKTASYVAKNGRSFEQVLLSKDRSRFSFLSAGDKHFNYYLHKLNIYLTGNYDPSVTAEPLAFKLNKKQEASREPAVVKNNPISGLDYSSDSDEHDNDDEDDKTNSNGDNKKNFPNLAGFLPPTITSNPQLYSDPGEESKNEEDLKKREETNKLRDKLAAKAREKMVQV